MIIKDTKNHWTIIKQKLHKNILTFSFIINKHFLRIYSLKVHSTWTYFFRSGKCSQINNPFSAFTKYQERMQLKFHWKLKYITTYVSWRENQNVQLNNSEKKKIPEAKLKIKVCKTNNKVLSLEDISITKFFSFPAA